MGSMSSIRIRVANSDWWASRSTTSVIPSGVLSLIEKAFLFAHDKGAYSYFNVCKRTVSPWKAGPLLTREAIIAKIDPGFLVRLLAQSGDKIGQLSPGSYSDKFDVTQAGITHRSQVLPANLTQIAQAPPDNRVTTEECFPEALPVTCPQCFFCH